jgi:hypothetical protein
VKIEINNQRSDQTGIKKQGKGKGRRKNLRKKYRRNGSIKQRRNKEKGEKKERSPYQFYSVYVPGSSLDRDSGCSTQKR